MSPLVPIIVSIIGGMFVAFRHDPYWWTITWASVVCAIYIWVNRRDMVPAWAKSPMATPIRKWEHLAVGLALWVTLSLAVLVLASGSYWIAHAFFWPD